MSIREMGEMDIKSAGETGPTIDPVRHHHRG